MAQWVKNLPAMQETWVQSLGWEDPMEKGKATHSSILAWRIPWTVYSPWGCKETLVSDFHYAIKFSGLPRKLSGKESACNVGDPGSIPGLRSYVGEGIGYHSSILGLSGGSAG